jgi:hypothetical protein
LSTTGYRHFALRPAAICRWSELWVLLQVRFSLPEILWQHDQCSQSCLILGGRVADQGGRLVCRPSTTTDIIIFNLMLVLTRRRCRWAVVGNCSGYVSVYLKYPASMTNNRNLFVFWGVWSMRRPPSGDHRSRSTSKWLTTSSFGGAARRSTCSIFGFYRFNFRISASFHFAGLGLHLLVQLCPRMLNALHLTDSML